VDATTFENPFAFLVMGFTGGFTIAMFMHFAIFKMSGAPRMVEFFLGPD
jgi:hypothetical protein